MAGTLIPGSAEWARFMTASKAAGALGLSPWESPLSTWLRMAGHLPPAADATDAMRRGHLLEPALIEWTRQQHPELLIRAAKVTRYSSRLDWAAANLDGYAVPADRPRSRNPHIVIEAKTDSDGSSWGQPGTDEVPPYYWVQAQWQMHLTGARVCLMPMIGPWLRFAEYVIEYDERRSMVIEAKLAQFVATLAADEPPPLSDNVAHVDIDFASLREAHPDIVEDEVVTLPAADAREYLIAKEAAGQAKERLTRAGSTIALQLRSAKTGVVHLADGTDTGRDMTVVERRSRMGGTPFLAVPTGKRTPDISLLTTGVPA